MVAGDVKGFDKNLALAAPDPQAAVELATQKKSADPRYSTRDFRRDVELLNEGRQAEEVEALTWVSVGLTAEDVRNLEEVKRRCTCDAQTAIKLALRDKAEWGICPTLSFNPTEE